MRKINKLLDRIKDNKKISLVLLPVLLLLFWITLSLLYSSYRSFTVLQYAHNSNDFSRFSEATLMRGKSIAVEFKGQENNLGIVAVRFGYVPKTEYKNDDILLFQIKEKGKNTWFYENEYRSSLLTSNQYFPFGFVEQDDSKGKEYQFQITSLSGDKNNSVEVVKGYPYYLTKYKFQKKDIFLHPGSFTSFVQKKLITFLTNTDSLLSSFVFLLPFVFYMIWIALPKEKKIRHKFITGKRLFAFFSALLIISDVFFIEFMLSGFMLGLIGLWVVAAFIAKLKSATTFMLSFALIIISLIGIYFDFQISINKATTFAYLLLVLGFIQSVVEYRKRRRFRT